MAEVQTTTSSGEMTLRFIEFVRMHAQNATLFLGRIPNPQTGKQIVNLEVARMLIEQLAAIAFKTRGNLTPDEEAVLSSSLASLQKALVEVSATRTAGGTPSSQAQPQQTSVSA